MNPESFFENFSLLAETPNGIPKLREMILQMAVQGKLVPQNPDDEPAEVLLERIKEEKQRLVKEGIIRKSKDLPAIEDDNIPYSIPDNWKWCRIGDIGQVIGGGTPKTSNSQYFSENGVSWLTPADLYDLKGKFIGKGKRDISELGLKNSSAQLMPTGTVLFSSRAPIGYVAIALNEIATNQGFKSCVPTFVEMNEYVYYFLKSAVKDIENNASGTTFKEVSGKIVSLILFPLPPLEEQKRIVAKVDQLMELCDQLEFLQQKKHESRIHLNNAALNKMLDAGSPEEFADNWRLVCDNFGLLYDNLENVEKLRQAILQLAVMGKIVEQDDEDEPAEVLLEKIKAEKEELAKEGKIKKSKPLSLIKDDDIPYFLPSGWTWERIGNIITGIKGGGTPSKRNAEYWDGSIPWASVKDLNQGKFLNTTMDKITQKGLEGSSTNLIPKDNIIICTRMGLGKIAINTIDVTINQDLKALSLSQFISIDYFYNYYLTQEIKGSGMTVSGIRQDALLNKLIPVPPLEEQKRIVAKVDQLMELCNRLEAGIRQAQEDGEKLMEAVVNDLLV